MDNIETNNELHGVSPVAENPDDFMSGSLPDITVTEIPGTKRTRGKISIRWNNTTALIASALIVILLAVGAFWMLQRSQTRYREARNRLAMGQAALLDGDLYLALYQYTRAIENDPNLPGAHSALGRIAIANGQGDDAVRHFKAELKLTPGDRQSHLALGCIYALGCIPPDDPHQVRAYLLTKFNDVIPLNWIPTLVFTPEPDIDPLSKSVYHFQYAHERLPGDPAPVIGLALINVATYNLSNARDRLSTLSGQSDDQAVILIARTIIEDINREELYQSQLAMMPTIPAETPVDIPVPRPSTDYAGNLAVLPPIAGLGENSTRVSPELSPLPPVNQLAENSGGFGSRSPSPNTPSQGTNPANNMGRNVAYEDLVRQPTVKPVSNDIRIQETGEWVRTVRLANITQPGNVGFRQGETVVMPNTNIEVKVIEVSNDRIVLEERGSTFTWIKSDVGWVQDTPDMGPPAPPSLNITSDDSTGSDTAPDNSDSDNNTDTTEDELGPEVE